MKRIVPILLTAILFLSGCSGRSDVETTAAEKSIAITEATTKESIVDPTEKSLAMTETTTEESIVDPTEKSLAMTETTAEESIVESSEFSSVDFVNKIASTISDSVGYDDKITNISFDNGDLRVYVELGDPSPLTYDDLMFSRTSSITDAILSLSEYLDTWDTITVDFGTLGHIKNSKSNMADDGYGPYFLSSNFVIE